MAFGIWQAVTTRSSVQFPQSMLDEAELFGSAAHTKPSTARGNPVRAIILAIRVEAFPFFCTELADDFAAPQDWDPASVRYVSEAARRYFTARAAYEMPTENSKEQRLRQKIRSEVTRPIRDRRFAASVLRAYGHRCAVCGVQLDLVEAAHIDPVEDPLSTDDVQNGIALCPLHHDAYDDGLLHLEPNGIVRLDEDRVKGLKQRSRDGGLDNFRKTLSSVARFPADESLRPDSKFMEARTRFLNRE
jgi:hypothetical protein